MAERSNLFRNGDQQQLHNQCSGISKRIDDVSSLLNTATKEINTLKKEFVCLNVEISTLHIENTVTITRVPPVVDIEDSDCVPPDSSLDTGFKKTKLALKQDLDKLPSTQVGLSLSGPSCMPLGEVVVPSSMPPRSSNMPSLSKPPRPIPKPPRPLPKPPGPLPKPPGPLPKPPGSLPKPPGSLSKPPRSLSKPPRSLSKPPRSLSKPPRSLSKPPRPIPKPPKPIPKPFPKPPRPFPKPPGSLSKPSGSLSKPSGSLSKSSGSPSELSGLLSKSSGSLLKPLVPSKLRICSPFKQQELSLKLPASSAKQLRSISTETPYFQTSESFATHPSACWQTESPSRQLGSSPKLAGLLTSPLSPMCKQVGSPLVQSWSPSMQSWSSSKPMMPTVVQPWIPFTDVRSSSLRSKSPFIQSESTSAQPQSLSTQLATTPAQSQSSSTQLATTPAQSRSPSTQPISISGQVRPSFIHFTSMSSQSASTSMQSQSLLTQTTPTSVMPSYPSTQIRSSSVQLRSSAQSRHPSTEVKSAFVQSSPSFTMPASTSLRLPSTQSKMSSYSNIKRCMPVTENASKEPPLRKKTFEIIDLSKDTSPLYEACESSLRYKQESGNIPLPMHVKVEGNGMHSSPILRNRSASIPDIKPSCSYVPCEQKLENGKLSEKKSNCKRGSGSHSLTEVKTKGGKRSKINLGVSIKKEFPTRKLRSRYPTRKK